MTAVVVEIRGTDLPGRRCGPRLDGRMCENVHVGLWHKTGPVELVPGDARLARWELALEVRRDEAGALDFRGPFVAGRRDERSLELLRGTLGRDDSFDVFRAAKLRLEDLDDSLVEQALEGGGRLVCSLGLTDEYGYPRCASIRPPLVSWSAESGSRRRGGS